MKITYIHHSAFCVEIDGKALVFDYYRGDGIPSCVYHGKLPELPEELPVYVFSSHSHQDHFDPEVLQWSKNYPNIYYIFSKDIKKKLGNSALKRLGLEESVKERITYVKPGERHEIGGVTVETLLSTDSGVAFLATVSGKTIYHAGDLNWWRWEGEPEAENEYQEKTYKEQIELLSGRKIDLAFVVLDPRQEGDKYLGIDYFLEHVQAEWVVPMHMWKEYGVIQECRSLPRNASVREKILAVERENQEIIIETRKKVIIFDFDYTLGDSTKGIAASVNYALEKMKLEPAAESAIVKTIGLSLEETYQVLTGRNDSQEADAFKAYFREKADEVMTASTRIYDGVREMLARLQENGKKTAIVTTKYHYRIEQILAASQMEDLIDAIIGGEDVKQAKPDPEGVWKIKGQFGVSLEDILYVGDSVVDAKTAQRAGVDFAAVLTGATAAEEFQDYPCYKILDCAGGEFFDKL